MPSPLGLSACPGSVRLVISGHGAVVPLSVFLERSAAEEGLGYMWQCCWCLVGLPSQQLTGYLRHISTQGPALADPGEKIYKIEALFYLPQKQN